jgi:hypothetical protein
MSPARAALLVVAASGAFAATAVGSRNAWAAGPVDVELSTRTGYATNPTPGEPNALGFEFGGRLGLAWSNVYGGLSLMYAPGHETYASCAGPVINPCTTSTVGVSAHSLRYGLEAGYDLRLLHWLTVRPGLGVGVASLFESSPAQIVVNQKLEGLDGSERRLYLEPGVSVLFSLGVLILGADANAIWMPGLDRSQAAFTTHGQVGLRF